MALPLSLQSANWVHLGHSVINATGIVGAVHLCESQAGDLALIYATAVLVHELAERSKPVRGRLWKTLLEAWRRWRG